MTRWRPFVQELAAVAATALVYYLVRGAVSERAAEALQRARDILTLEQRLRLDWEMAIQESILSSGALIDFANGVYFWGHMPLLVVAALYLWHAQRPLWRRLRSALLLSAAAGMVCYLLLPTAPPRLMPELGYIDTLAARSAPAYQAQEVGLFVNPYAALPSLHVGWALLAGIALWQTSTRWSTRALALAIPLSQCWAVVATANHWTLDAVAGIALCAAAWLLAPAASARLGQAVGSLRRRPTSTVPAVPTMNGAPDADRDHPRGSQPRDRRGLRLGLGQLRARAQRRARHPGGGQKSVRGRDSRVQAADAGDS